MDEKKLDIIKKSLNAFDDHLISKKQPTMGKIERVIVGGYLDWLIDNYPKIAKEISDEFTK